LTVGDSPEPGMSGPEIRIDQLTGMRTILAAGRAGRPDSFSAPRHQPKGPEGCPFCEGHEDRTPPEVDAIRPEGEANGTGWRVRAVPNLYPALAPVADGAPALAPSSTSTFAAEGDPLSASRRAGEADLFSSRPATGAHEVVINSPIHATSMAELDEEQFSVAVEGWRRRMRAHRDSAYVQLILNEGGGAGASLEHTHAQLYALPFVPAPVARERERFRAYSERTAGGDLVSDVLVEEVRRRDRLVAIDEDAALICPWASRSPFELRLIPRRPQPRFEDDDVGAPMLRRGMRALAERLGGPPELNLWVQTAPRGAEEFRWHVDLLPRLTIRAGFELATGIDINVYPPERAAADLRETLDG
jgi:UDPglucose--hexose-1-phosphate uridylyltransferase